MVVVAFGSSSLPFSLPLTRVVNSSNQCPCDLWANIMYVEAALWPRFEDAKSRPTSKLMIKPSRWFPKLYLASTSRPSRSSRASHWAPSEEVRRFFSTWASDMAKIYAWMCIIRLNWEKVMVSTSYRQGAKIALPPIVFSPLAALLRYARESEMMYVVGISKLSLFH